MAIRDLIYRRSYYSGSEQSTAISSQSVHRGKISFVFVISYILGSILKSRKLILVASIILDTLNAATRIGAVFALSIFATTFQSEESYTLSGYIVDLPKTLIGKTLLAAGVISGLLALSAIFNYLSVILARRMARVLNEDILSDLINGLSVPPKEAIKTIHRPVADFNRMLTQNGFHYGMMGESLLRMANPCILFVMACGTILYLSPLLGVGALIFSLLFLPIFAKLVSRTRNIAQAFYAEQASEMGTGVSSAVLELSTQYGGFHPEKEYASQFPHKPFMKNFLSAFDNNILANERMSFAVGLVGAFVIFAIISSTGILFSRGALDAKAMIAVIGAFVFLMTSTRTVASHITNLIRFYPQVQFILEFLTPLKKAIKSDSFTPSSFNTLKRQLETRLNIENLVDARLGYYTGEAVSKFTLNSFLEPLIDDTEGLAEHTQFINASYRFRNNAVLIDLLDPLQRGTPITIQSSAKTLGVFDEFNSLPNGLHTVMTENIWNMLSGDARSALRLIPLALEPSEKVIFLDIGVISNLNPLSFEEVFSIFQNKIFFIVLNDQYCPDNLVEDVIVKNENNVMRQSLDDFRAEKLLDSTLTTGVDKAFTLTSIL